MFLFERNNAIAPVVRDAGPDPVRRRPRATWLDHLWSAAETGIRPLFGISRRRTADLASIAGNERMLRDIGLGPEDVIHATGAGPRILKGRAERMSPLEFPLSPLDR